MGDLILSKSVNNRIFLWQKDAKDDVSGMKGFVHLLHVRPSFVPLALAGMSAALQGAEHGLLSKQLSASIPEP
jgi:hypothetical protein